MKNLNKIKLLLAVAAGLFLILGNVKTSLAAAPNATNLSAAETYTEDTSLNLVDIVTSDADNDPLTVTLTLSNTAAGSLTTGTSGAVTSTYNPGTGLWTASGAIASVNALLAGVTFVPTANFNGNFTIATSVTDGNTSPLTGTKNITGTPVNDAPVLDASKSPTLPTLSEDANLPSGAVGSLVSSIVDFATPSGQVDNVTDVDSGAVLGIAIIGADQANLTCYYSTNNGATWVALGTVSDSSARNLAADSSSRLYCRPNADVNGSFNALTFRAWDQTAGTNGSTANISLGGTGGSTAYSTASDTIGLTVTAVNDAPTATNMSAAETYTQDTPLNLIDIVVSDIDSTNVTATLTLSDPSAGTLSTGTSGAVTATYTAGTGTWAATGAIANVNALLASVTFIPANGYNSNFTIGASVSDGIAPAITGAKSMTGIAVSNHAPVLDATKSPQLNGIPENSGGPVGTVGTSISNIVDFTTPAGGLDNVSDSDASPSLGVAVVGTDVNLTCYYSINDGASWSPMGAVSNTNARLLSAAAGNRIYCQPALNQTGTVATAITFRAWDRTSGSNGGLATTASNGGSTAFSAANDTASMEITAPLPPAPDTDSFITVWKTDNAGTSTDHQITIPAYNDATYDVDWGDSNTSTNLTGPATHSYTSIGTYTVKISGAGFNGMAFGDSGDRLKLLEVQQWGTAVWKSMSGAFFGASNLTITATDSPDLSTATDLQYAFRDTTFTTGGLANWDVSHISSFSGVFQGSTFNEDISGWDMSAATNTVGMFYADTAFNQDISSWNTGSVSDFSSMFEGATGFDQNLGAWDIRAATHMNSMFHGDTLSTANYDDTLTGWISHGIFSIHPNVHFDGGNSKFCNIDSWLEFVEVPNTWTVTDGGIGNCPMVLTEVTPIPASVKAADAVYHFSADSQIEESYAFHFGDYQATAPSCGNCATHIDPVAHTVSFTGLKPGDHMDINISFVTNGGISNLLEVGPFTVKSEPGSAGGGSVANPAVIPQSQSGAHPNGTLIISGQTIYLIKDGKRWGFRDPAEYGSYGYKFGQAVQANSADLALPFDGANILKAMPGTLVLDKTDGKTVYMIGSNYNKRGFVSASVFNSLGYSFKNLPVINLSDYPTGQVIASAKDSHPEGSLVLDSKTVWWILNGTKQGFESQQVFDTYGFTSARLVKANPADTTLSSGALVKLRDGTLVNENGLYYIISDGKKREFTGSAQASTLGYNLSNFISASLQNYSAGLSIN